MNLTITTTAQQNVIDTEGKVLGTVAVYTVAAGSKTYEVSMKLNGTVSMIVSKGGKIPAYVRVSGATGQAIVAALQKALNA